MKFTNNAQAALGQPDTKAIAIPMTPELRDKYKRVSGEVIDLLKRNTKGPVEAYMILQFVQHAFEDAYDIRGGIIAENADQKS